MLNQNDSEGEIRESSQYFNWLLWFIAGLILVSPVVLFFASPHLPIEFLNLVTILDVVVSLLLSLVLVYVYMSLKGVQDTQTDILDEQESLMRLQHLPRIEIAAWDVDENVLKFTLANVGEGAATGIGAGIRVIPQNIDYSQGFQVSTKSLYQADHHSRKNFLNANETKEFVGPAFAKTIVDNVQHWKFTRVVNYLINKGEHEIEFIITLRYFDPIRKNTDIEITSRTTEIQRDMTFEQAMEGSRATNTVPMHIPYQQEIEKYNNSDYFGIYFDPKEQGGQKSE
ncbi:hypothetical protein [Halorubrum sp. F4]|uniref:hypothetical protein n=1 Tax=Halorubrum sp. F4 TaxID=2989715 RepID=UPI0024804537|nr:hypothetical protein [Halorubrum sp. F4]